MEYEIEERPLQMGEDWEPQRPFGYGAATLGIASPALRRPETRDRAVLIPEQEPLS